MEHSQSSKNYSQQFQINCSYCSQHAICLIGKKLCYPQQYALTSSAARWGCEHETAAVDEFFDWLTLGHDHPELSSCFVINKSTLFSGKS